MSLKLYDNLNLLFSHLTINCLLYVSPNVVVYNNIYSTIFIKLKF